MYIFSDTSHRKLNTCHPDLIRLFSEVIKHRDCKVLCGRRSKVEQDALYPKFTKVKYPNSQHNKVPSMAIDVVPYPVDWQDIDRFREFAGFVLGIAAMLEIKVKWGGHFKTFFDGPHWQVD